ncbi:MAG: helix-turn-helix domain-containing protein [Lactobacillus sp.]|jgi:AraC-like DNA-binding protein|nr:helix-turn-helix domain-containing protein [Lactobacillus sp.]
MDPKIMASFLELNDIEKLQHDSKSFHNDIPMSAVSNPLSFKAEAPVLNNYFFKNKDIFIRKHNRFAPYPMHTHTFLEMNYMLRGSADERVDGEHIHLSEGDLLLLDVGCKHAIAALGENDVMVNILFRDQDISIRMLNDMRRNRSVLYEFLLNRTIKKQNIRKFMLFQHNDRNDEVRSTLDHIIAEYFQPREFSNSIIKNYLSILMTQLVRNYNVRAKEISESQRIVLKVLRDITNHYRSISLESEAKKYNYNKNYLSNVFKKEAGKTFSTALTQQRLIHARSMVTSTTMPISDIIEAIGMSNKNFFYKKYNEQYNSSPGQDRANAESDALSKKL